MKHFFARRLVSYFWNGHDYTRILSSFIANSRIFKYTEISREYRKKWHINGRIYLTLPKFIAWDFFTGAREALSLPQNKYRKFQTLKKATTAIAALPETGWVLSNWKVILIKPVRSGDLFVVMGSAFQVIHSPITSRHNNVLFEYTGKNVRRKILKIAKHKDVFAQVAGTGLDQVCFWDLEPLTKRKGLYRKRRRAQQIDKSTLGKNWI